MSVGIYHDFTLNGADLILSRGLEPVWEPRQSIVKTMTGRNRVSRSYDGAGLPDVLDVAEFKLDWDLDDDNVATITQIEKARAMAGPHDFVIWKKRFVAFTASAGQQTFYLPRPDAFPEAYTGHTASEDEAVVTVTPIATGVEGSQAVTYQASVDADTVVTAGELWISNASAAHPETGALVTCMKFGTALAAGDVVMVEYFPLYRVQITNVSTRFEMVGREDKSVVLIEVND